jgi:transcriptional regulator with XRE-family HTH domain
MALRIRHLRESKGWTQADLAEKAGMSRSQLAMIEAETRPANTLRLNSIAAALGVVPEALFDSGDESWRLAEIVRALTPPDRAILVQMAEALASKLHKD